MRAPPPADPAPRDPRRRRTPRAETGSPADPRARRRARSRRPPRSSAAPRSASGPSAASESRWPEATSRRGGCTSAASAAMLASEPVAATQSAASSARRQASSLEPKRAIAMQRPSSGSTSAIDSATSAAVTGSRDAGFASTGERSASGASSASRARLRDGSRQHHGGGVEAREHAVLRRVEARRIAQLGAHEREQAPRRGSARARAPGPRARSRA